MTSSILFAGQEDISFTPIGTTYQLSNVITSSSTIICDQNYINYRSGYARYAPTIGLSSNSSVGNNNTFIRSSTIFNANVFWTGSRMYLQSTGAPNVQSKLIRWLDSNSVVRLQITTTGALPNTIMLQKVDSSNVATTLVTSTSNLGTQTPSTPDKVDVYINYSTAGTFNVYFNGNLLVTYSGNITTNSTTSLSQIDFGSGYGGGNSNVFTGWSECVCANVDTRKMSLVTQVASAPGNTDNWTSGSNANVSGTLADYVSPDYSSTQQQLQQYEVIPAMPAGNFSVVSLVQQIAVIQSNAAPQHIQLVVRSGSTNFYSATLNPTLSWSTLSANWDQNPNTAIRWKTTDLANSSNSFNLGYLSLT